MSRASTDVAIAGGGPAGCAAALMLRQHAPGLDVTLLEGSDYSGPRLGETLPPLARTLLRQLGLLPAFESFRRDGGAREVHGTEIAWAEADPRHEPYLAHARGSGWHLDRARFDAWLAGACSERGVEVRRLTRVRGIREIDGRRRLDLAIGEAREAGRLDARFVIDAAGRSAPIARRLGAESHIVDRLVAHARFFDGASRDATLTVEAVSHGWWYTAGLPGGRTAAVALSDAELAREQVLHDGDGWMRALEETTLTRRRIEDLGEPGPLLIRSAASRRLEPASGENWLAAGDAASVFDPLSSQGLTKSLRSGIFAAYAVSDLLRKGDAAGVERYRRFISDEFERYLETRLVVYASERRWPDEPFWRRRTPDR